MNPRILEARIQAECDRVCNPDLGLEARHEAQKEMYRLINDRSPEQIALMESKVLGSNKTQQEKQG